MAAVLTRNDVVAWVWTMHNISQASDGVIAKLGRKVFDPIKIFRGGLLPTAVMATFFLLDVSLRAVGKQTSVMTAIFRKA